MPCALEQNNQQECYWRTMWSEHLGLVAVVVFRQVGENTLLQNQQWQYVD
jgi:hypothetical protein